MAYLCNYVFYYPVAALIFAPFYKTQTRTILLVLLWKFLFWSWLSFLLVEWVECESLTPCGCILYPLENSMYREKD